MRAYTHVVEQYSIYNSSDAYILIDQDNNTHVITSDIYINLLNMLRVYGIEQYDVAFIIADRVDKLLHFGVVSDATLCFIETVLSLVKNRRLFEAMPPCNDMVIPSTARKLESFISTRYTCNTANNVSEDDFEPPSMDELMQLLQACT